MASGVSAKSSCKCADLVDEQLQALDLDRRPRKAVEHDAVAVDLVEQLAQQDAQDLLVADHAALRLDLLHLRRREQLADHDRRTGQAARLADELRLRPLAGAGRAAEQDDLLRKAQIPRGRPPPGGCPRSA